MALRVMEAFLKKTNFDFFQMNMHPNKAFPLANKLTISFALSVEDFG